MRKQELYPLNIIDGETLMDFLILLGTMVKTILSQAMPGASGASGCPPAAIRPSLGAVSGQKPKPTFTLQPDNQEVNLRKIENEIKPYLYG